MTLILAAICEDDICVCADTRYEDSKWPNGFKDGFDKTQVSSVNLGKRNDGTVLSTKHHLEDYLRFQENTYMKYAA